MNIVLIGFMASGKTSVGRRLASRLGYPFVDTDSLIEKQAGLSITGVFSMHGETVFREMETVVARELKNLKSCVISTGGGLPITPGNLDLLREAGLVVFLKADPEDLVQRLQRDVRRPKVQEGDPRETVMKLYAERIPIYTQADMVIETNGKSLNRVTGEVIANLAEVAAAKRSTG